VALNGQCYTFFYGHGKEDHQLGTGSFVHKRIIPAVRRVEFISDGMSYIILGGRWCNIIILNVHAPCLDKGGDVKDSFYEELDVFLISFLGTIRKFYWVISMRR
jgi:hypothetical protein